MPHPPNTPAKRWLRVSGDFAVHDKAGTPPAQQGPIANAAGGITVDAEARAALNALLAALRAYGFIAE